VQKEPQRTRDLEQDGVGDHTELGDQPLLGDGFEVLAFRVADLIKP
jgi:hypothetical protein